MPKIQLLKHGDGTVWRSHVCECGTTIYKKNVTTGEIQFLVKRDSPGHYKTQTVKASGNPSALTVSCPACGAHHIVADIKESMQVEASVELSTKKVAKKRKPR